MQNAISFQRILKVFHPDNEVKKNKSLEIMKMREIKANLIDIFFYLAQSDDERISENIVLL